jgi:hypothetical protein
MMIRRFAQSITGRFARARAGSLATVLALGLSLTIASAASAQPTGSGFLFSEPRWTLGVRGGFDRANASSDIFQFMTDTLTLDRGDFSGFTFGADLAYSITPRVDIVAGAGYVRSKKTSEFREYYEVVGTTEIPINQTTTFSRLPLTGTLKAYLFPRGRSIGSLAWVPAKFSPYIGVGGGALRYEFRQEGDFVFPRENSTEEFDIAYDKFVSSGWTPTAHALLGAEIALTPRLGFSTEGRYGWARSDLSADFVGFEQIDLSGFSATMGFIIRF